MSFDEQRDYEPIHPRGTDWAGRIRKLVGPVIALVIAAAKFGFVLVKFSSIFIAIAAYALIFGWKFAVGFVLLIFIHELGHYVEAKREGLSPKLPVFIPSIRQQIVPVASANGVINTAAIAGESPCGPPSNAGSTWPPASSRSRSWSRST